MMMIPIEEMTHKELLHTQQITTTDVAMASSSSSSSSSPSPSPATAAIEDSFKRFSDMQSGRTKLQDVDVVVVDHKDHKIIPPRHRRMITFNVEKSSKASASTSTSKALALSSLKRSRPSSTKTTAAATTTTTKSCCSSFDMSTFEQASNEVQDSLWFPMIEWPTTSEDDDSNDDYDYDGDGTSTGASSSLSRSRKRLCRGLVRSSSTIDLSSFLVGTRTAVAVDAISCCRRSSC